MTLFKGISDVEMYECVIGPMKADLTHTQADLSKTFMLLEKVLSALAYLPKNENNIQGVCNLL